ncbi:hypothetical protein MTR67_048472 [Solanum verrucosum]|uniref:Uncharacterized protein n=1 Tax=Solanum verrucosum TaxID=315347 RepID=A0AAF0UYH5_SOLVR|nr:hypothetical protein MTR67_048472 [Solanum verrucosum]
MDTTYQKGAKEAERTKKIRFVIAEPIQRVAKRSHSAFCSSVLSLEGKDPVGKERSSQRVSEQFR